MKMQNIVTVCLFKVFCVEKIALFQLEHYYIFEISATNSLLKIFSNPNSFMYRPSERGKA